MGWQRPGRFHFMGSRGPTSKTYDTKENKVQKRDIICYFLDAGFKDEMRHEGPVRMIVTLVKSRPKRLMRRADPEGLVYCPSKPDWDNCGKMIGDALNTIAYKDDAQICDARVLKFFHEKMGRPRTEITMEFLAW